MKQLNKRFMKGRENVMDKSIEEREKTMNKFLEEIDKKQKATEASMTLANSPHAKRRLLDQKKSEAQGICLDLIFNKIYKDALPMDDEYKIAHGGELDNEFRDFIQMKAPDGLECYVKESIKRGSVPAKMLMEEVEKLVKEHYKEASLNIEETNVDDMDFDPNEEETRARLEDITDKMSTEEISDIIKDNVKKAAIADITNAKAHQDEMKSLVDDLKQDPSLTTEAAIDRKLGVMGLKTPEFYQPSLFEGIMINKTNLIKESGEDLSTEEIGKKAYFESVKELTKLSVLNALNMENINRNQKGIANEYAKMRVPSSKVSFYKEGYDMLREQRYELMEEGANLDSRAVFKNYQKIYKTELRAAKAAMKKEKYDKAIGHLKNAKNQLVSAQKKIDSLESTVGSHIFAWLWTSWAPFWGRTLLSFILVPFSGIISVATLIERIAVLVKTDSERPLGQDDFNPYKNALRVKLMEYEKIIDNTIAKVKALK
nr:MAG TPA: hypothetical protein [Caudoviricetes sp.]